MFFVIFFAEDGRQGTGTYLKIEDWQRHDQHRHTKGLCLTQKNWKRHDWHRHCQGVVSSTDTAKGWCLENLQI